MKFLAALMLSLTLTAAALHAQTLENEGVVGDMDRQSRNPHLTVGVTAERNQVTILADAYHPSDEFKKYPIQFEFFVNRQLFATQYRSEKLPGPIGVTVPSSVAKVPFNYVVIAKVIHPNSVYTTVIEGAATAASDEDATPTPTPTPGGGTQPAKGDYACTVVIGSSTYSASDVAIDGDAGIYTSDFDAKTADGKTTVSVSSKADITSSDSDNNGTVTVSEKGKTDVTFTGAVDFKSDNDEVTNITIASADNKNSFVCAK